MIFKATNTGRKTIGKCISSFCIIILLLSILIPCKSVFANSDFLIKDGALISYSGNGGEVIIPNTVKTINSYVFVNKKNITSITIPQSVVRINDHAFEGCSGLTKVVIPSSVKTIGSFAFINCSNLKSIKIPKSVTSIGGLAFSKTPWLEAKKKSSKMVIVNNILIDGQLCKGKIVIPDKVRVVGASAFWQNSNITKVTIPKSVKTISNAAFASCNGLTKVVIPNSVTSILNNAFNQCSKLSSITIPKSVTRIDGNVFNDTPWMNVKLKESKLVIINGILLNAKQCTGKVTIPENVKVIGSWAFYESDVTEVVLPSSVTTINHDAFPTCKYLRSLTIPDSVKLIEDYAIDDSYKSITIIGKKGSAAESYANKYEIKISEAPLSENNKGLEVLSQVP